jgi:probable F420-dependent oxidoreductase
VSNGSRLRLAVTLSHIDTLSRPGQADLLALAAAADRAGADQLVLSEHVTLPGVVESHPGAKPGDAAGKFPFPSGEEYPEPMVALAAISTVTSRARLSTNILIAPLRPAVLLAKQAATLDCLSGGRLDLGVGAGWLEEEFAALGVPYQRLNGRMEDIVRACQTMWKGGPTSFSSPTVSFTDMVCSPTPVQSGGIPIWFGGSASERTATRVATLGAGWSPIGNTTIEDIAAGVRLIAAVCERIGRDPASISVRCTLPMVRGADGRPDPELTGAGGARLAEAGATIVQMAPLFNFASSVDEVEPVLKQVLAALP